MKRKVLIVLVMAVMVLFNSIVPANASVNSQIVLNFDELVDGGFGDFLPANYAGLNWDPAWFWWSWEQNPYTPSSPNTRIATHNYGGWIDFSPLGAPVIFEGAYFSGFPFASVFFEGYRDGMLIGTSASLAPSDTPTFLPANFGEKVDYVKVVSASINYFAMDDLTFTVNQPPTADANGPYLGAAGSPIAFDGTGSSDPDGDPLTYNWDFGDGNTGTGASLSYAYINANIYDVCLTVDDSYMQDTACTDAVVYDPSAGFATGGGWINSPEGTVPPQETTVFFNGFETDIEDWLTPTRVPSGNNGIASAAGIYHAEAVAGDYTRWGGYSSLFPTGGFITAIDVYLDMNAGYANDTRFDWSSAINAPDGSHRRDFVFTGGFYNDTTGPGAGVNRFVFSASNNTPGWPKNPGRDPIAITTTGWYTLQHHFYDSGAGVLAVDLSILDSAGNVIYTWTLSDPSDVIGVTVGGNRYGWLVTNGFSFLAIDNSIMKELFSPTGKANFSFVSKYQKSATVPEGNTEFQFHEAGLNFHSDSYEWLVVTGSNFARFKGVGSINGEGEYKFMIWAGDGNPDTFRIKIWWEDADGEHVVYDNGFDQPIGGGSIVIHTSK